MQIQDLLKDYSGDNSVESIVEYINTKASELKAKIFIDDNTNHYVPKTRLDAVLEAKSVLEDSVKDLKKKLEKTEGNEATIEDLTSKLTKANEIAKKSAIKAALVDKLQKLNSIAPVDDIYSLLDIKDLVIKDSGEVTGLDEALNNLKSSKSYLFPQQNTNTNQSGGTGDPGKAGSNTTFQKGQQKPGEFGKLLSESVTQTNDTFDYFK